jgi:hypothetical protein
MVKVLMRKAFRLIGLLAHGKPKLREPQPTTLIRGN